MFARRKHTWFIIKLCCQKRKVLNVTGSQCTFNSKVIVISISKTVLDRDIVTTNQ